MTSSNGNRLRIAQLAPAARPVTPDSSGSVEQIVSLLTEELVARGHSVTLFATGNSRTSARLEARYPCGYVEDPELWEWEFHELLHTAFALERAHEFDVVHSHVYHYGLPFTRLVSTPVVHTYHVLPDDHVIRAYEHYPEAELVSISNYQRGELNGARKPPVIYHGIDTDAFPFTDAPDDYLLFLGKLSYAKGAVEAIHVAKEAGMRLVLAGAGDPDDEYYRAVVAPLLDDPVVEYVGWVDAATRNDLMSRAAALLYPINVAETFGLVLVEAMACGTPVLATTRGAVPEIVENGVTGFHAPALDSLIQRLPDALALDRARVRDEAVRRFDRGRMVDEYESLYRRLAHEPARELA